MKTKSYSYKAVLVATVIYFSFLTVASAQSDTLKLKFLLEGYYIGGGQMNSVLSNQGVDSDYYSGKVDTVFIELHTLANVSAVAASYTGILQYDGTLNCIFPDSLTNHAYYIVIKHRCSIETWSSVPVTMRDTISYNFTTDSAKAYQNNMAHLWDGKWALYTGDVTDSTQTPSGAQDGIIDLSDFTLFDSDASAFAYGYYATDFGGDGSVDIFDLAVLDNNITNGVHVQRPSSSGCSMTVHAVTDSAINCHGGTTSVTVGATGGTGSIFGTTNFNDVSTGVHGYTLMDSYGCSASDTITITQPPCLDSLKLKFYIEGCYIGSGMMQPVLYYSGVDTNMYSTLVDTISVELHPPADVLTVAHSYKGILQRNGILNCTFPDSVTGGHAYYIVLKHRNALETWSAAPVTMRDTISYDFTTDAAKAYGNNMADLWDGKWGLYTGNVTDSTEVPGVKDDVIDMFDYYLFDSDASAFAYGYYATDFNGDGGVDIFDYFSIYLNIENNIAVMRPGNTSCSMTVEAVTDSNILCHGGTTSITLNHTGANGSVFGATHFTGVAAGIYNHSLTDSYGCSASATDTVLQPMALTANITSSTDISCSGASTGSATVAAGGGASPYTYSWSGGGTDADATGLSAGTYTVTVTDSNGCSASDTISIHLNMHNSPDAAIAIAPDNIYADYFIGDTALWFKFTADTNVLAMKITAPLNYTGIDSADLQSAKLYSGSPDDLTLLASWHANDVHDVYAEYADLDADSSYYLLLRKPSPACASFAAISGFLLAPPSCGTGCVLIGDGDFSYYTSCFDTVSQFESCVSCWSCSHGSPQIVFDSVGLKHIALMWASSDSTGEGIKHDLLSALRKAPNIMYVFRMKSRLDPGTDSTIHAGINACLTSTRMADDSMHCGVLDHQRLPKVNPNVKIDAVPNLTHNWTWTDTCIQSMSLPSTILGTLWIYPTTDSFATVNVDSVLLDKIDADIQDSSEICICSPTVLRRLRCPPPDDFNITYQWYRNDTLIPGATADTLLVDTSSVQRTYSLTMIYKNLNNYLDSVSDQVIISPYPCSFAVKIDPPTKQICARNDSATFTTKPSDLSFHWLWSTGATTPVIRVGGYVPNKDDTVRVTVTNIYGCTSTDTLAFHWLPLSAIRTDSAVIACQDTNYSITVVPAEGTPPYTYQWYNGDDQLDTKRADTTSTVLVTPGTYTVAVDDSGKHCTGIRTFTVGFAITSLSPASPKCEPNGSLTATLKPAAGHYTYSWSPGGAADTTAVLDSLAAGSYTLTVTDSLGCILQKSATLKDIFSVEIQSPDHIRCFPFTGTIKAKPDDGTKSYYYHWSKPGGIALTADTTADSVTVTGGTYIVRVTSGTCLITDTVILQDSLTIALHDTASPPQICRFQFSQLNDSATGSHDYIYRWSPPDGLSDTAIMNPTASPETTTLYTVTVKDSSGCLASDTVRVTVWPPVTGAPTLTKDSLVCRTFCINLHPPAGVIGGTPPYRAQFLYGLNYSPIGGPLPFDTVLGRQLCGLADGGYYTGILMDMNGCSTSASFNVMDTAKDVVLTITPPVTGYCLNYKDSITLTAAGAASYAWSTSTNTPSINVMPSTTTTYSVIGTRGTCADTIGVTINVNNACCMSAGYTELDSASLYLDSGNYSGNHTMNRSREIRAGSIVNFNGIDLLIHNAVAIIVDSGAVLNFNCTGAQNHLHACDSMWYGIIVRDGGILNMTGNCNLIEDAQYAIDARNNSSISMNSCTFNKNYVGLYVMPNPETNILKNGYINNCRFTCYGNLKPGYHNQSPALPTHTFAGMLIYNLAYLTLPGDVSSPPAYYNFFDSLNYGIKAYNSSINIRGGIFRYIQHFDGFANSAAIYMEGISGESFLYRGAAGITNFDHCFWGIKAVNMNVSIAYANMANTNSGILVQNCHATRSILLTLNNIAASFIGIGLNLNDGAQKNILNNTITRATTPEWEGATYGITSNEFGGMNKNSLASISSNNITMGNSKGNNGIYMRTTKGFDISQNTIKLKDFAKGDSTLVMEGIILTACTNVKTNCNVVLGTNTKNSNRSSLNHSGAFAIHTIDCSNFVHECDSINNTYEGFKFEGFNMGFLRSNKINQHIIGLHITSNGQIGTQSHQGNLWQGTSYIIKGALHENTQAAIQQKIIYNSSNPKHYTSNNYPTNVWFQSDSTSTDLDCNTNNCH